MRWFQWLIIVGCVTSFLGCEESEEAAIDDFPTSGTEIPDRPISSPGTSFEPGSDAESTTDSPVDNTPPIGNPTEAGGEDSQPEEQAPPVQLGSSTCSELLDCVSDCASAGEANCIDICLTKGTAQAQALLKEVDECVATSGCPSGNSECLQAACMDKMTACQQDGAEEESDEEGAEGGEPPTVEGGMESPGEEGGESPPIGEGTGSCEGMCGDGPGDCYCDETCTIFGDCCEDVCEACPLLGHCSGGEGDPGGEQGGETGGGTVSGSCAGACNGQALNGDCYCDDSCLDYGDCCDDICTHCPDALSCALE